MHPYMNSNGDEAGSVPPSTVLTPSSQVRPVNSKPPDDTESNRKAASTGFWQGVASAAGKKTFEKAWELAKSLFAEDPE